MTDAESKTFFADLFAYFPDVNEWIREKSPNPQKTLEGWRLCLSSLEYGVCDAVLKRMVTGAIEPPKAYERQRMAHHIRTHAYQLLSQQRERDELEERRQERDEGKRRGVKGRPAKSVCVDLMALWDRARSMFPDDRETQSHWVHEQTEGIWNDAEA